MPGRKTTALPQITKPWQLVEVKANNSCCMISPPGALLCYLPRSTSQRSWFFSATPLTSWKKGWGIQTGEARLVFTLLLPRKSRNFHLTAACCSFMEMASAAPSCRGQTCRCRVNKQQHFAFVLFLSFWEQIQSLKGSVCFSRLFMHALLSALWGFCSLCSHGSFPQLQKGLGWEKKEKR